MGFGSSDSTVRLRARFASGERVRIVAGPLKGISAEVVRQNHDDVLLLRLCVGVYLRMDKLFLDPES